MLPSKMIFEIISEQHGAKSYENITDDNNELVEENQGANDRKVDTFKIVYISYMTVSYFGLLTDLYY